MSFESVKQKIITINMMLYIVLYNDSKLCKKSIFHVSVFTTMSALH